MATMIERCQSKSLAEDVGTVSAERRPGRRWRKRSLGLVLGVMSIAMFSVGCIRVDVGIRVSDDGSGTVSFLSAIDSSSANSLAKSLGGTTSSEDSGLDLTKIDKSTLPPGSTVEPYKDGKYEGARVTAPFRPGDDIAAIVNQISNSTSSAEAGGMGDTNSSSSLFEHFALTKEADGWSFEATINPGTGMTSGADDFVTPEQLKALFKDASFTVRVKMPGTVVKHNADSVKNGELTWKIDIFATKARTLSARTGPSTGGGGFPVLPVAGGGALIVVVAIAAVLVVRRRQVTAAGVVVGGQAPEPPAEPPSANGPTA